MIAAIALAAAITHLNQCDAPSPRKGQVFAGVVTYVRDGDSLCVGRVNVRLGDFNAPETNQPGGPEAAAILRNLAMGRLAICLADHRSHRWSVSICKLADRSIGDLMREAGAPEGGR